MAERPVYDTIEGIAAWLIGPTIARTTGGRAVDEFAWRLLAAGIPLSGLSVHSGTLHPQFLGVTFLWWKATAQTTAILVAHEVTHEVSYGDNPVRRVIEGSETLRRRLEVDAQSLDFSILRDLKAKGCTDFLSVPVPSAHGSGYAVTYATDRAGGFSEREIADLIGISSRLQSVCDSYSQRALTQNLLHVYLGANAGAKVLSGQIRRGTGEELAAVLWSSDLRGFTERSDRLPGARMIAILNALLDAQANAIHAHGGEILKFIGDGLLAIFPIGSSSAADAAADALRAAEEAHAAVSALVGHPSMTGEAPLRIVVALHIGTVIYGNVGAANRLDFTVIGQAVNQVSRIEGVAKMLDEPIVVSDDYADAYGKPLRSLGFHTLRGVTARHELFGVRSAR